MTLKCPVCGQQAQGSTYKVAQANLAKSCGQHIQSTPFFVSGLSRADSWAFALALGLVTIGGLFLLGGFLMGVWSWIT